MGDQPEFSENLKKIKEEYLKNLPGIFEEMKGHIESLKNAPNLDVLTKLRFHVHKIAGNAGTFGYQKATDLCKPWDARLSEIMNAYEDQKVKDQYPNLEIFLNELRAIFQL